MFMKFTYPVLIVILLALSGCSTHQLKDQDGNSIPVLLSANPVDEKKTAPTVLIAHGSDGVQNFHREWAVRVQSWGYNAVIIDHYSFRGIAAHTGQFIPGVRGEDRARDMVQAGYWISKQPWHKGNMAVIGFSQGGGGVLALVAKQEDVEYFKVVKKGQKIPFAGAVAFYPACSLSPPPIKPTVPTQIHLAGDDTLALLGFCIPLDDPLYDVYKYAGATHAFDVSIPSTVRLNFSHQYDPNTSKDSQENTKKFLDKLLK
jgi:dienelactone hydrolase